MKITKTYIQNLIKEELKKTISEMMGDEEKLQKHYKGLLSTLNRIEDGQIGLNQMHADLKASSTSISMMKNLESARAIEVKSAAEKAKQVANHVQQGSPDDFNHKAVISYLDKIINSL